MQSRSFLPLLSLVLSACGGPQAGLWPLLAWPLPQSATPAAGTVRPAGPDSIASGIGAQYAQFDFSWQLAGDPEVMPLQVFDDGMQLWLQFPLEGAWPAVFEVGSEGLRPLPYRREGPYMVLGAVYEHLELRGGHLRGTVQRAVPPPPAAETGQSSPRLALAAVKQGTDLAATGAAAARTAAAGLQATMHRAEETHSGKPPAVLPEPVDTAALTATSFSVEPQPLSVAAQPSAVVQPKTAFTVGPSDVTMRQALERWAGGEGWTFAAEHWAVDVDIPLVGQASFQSDFKSAVRALLAATELGDRPLQPCFYSNRVLRVVPYAQACDRSKGVGVVS